MDIEHLRTLAEKAAQGPWHAASLPSGHIVRAQKLDRGGQWRRIAEVGSSVVHAELKREHAWTAAYIAACDPQTILALIEENDRLRAAIGNRRA